MIEIASPLGLDIYNTTISEQCHKLLTNANIDWTLNFVEINILNATFLDLMPVWSLRIQHLFIISMYYTFPLLLMFLGD